MNNKVYQDNQSEVSMDNNGLNSCTGISIHINTRHFFVKDGVDKGELKIEYCPTQITLVDYVTRMLKGKVFKIFRYVVMGHKLIS